MEENQIVKNHSPSLSSFLNELSSQEEVNKLINKITRGGKKNKARKIVYQAFELLEKYLLKQANEANDKNQINSLAVFLEALKNVKPTMECRYQAIGGTGHRVPYEIKPERSETLGLRFLKQAMQETKKKTKKPASHRLFQAIVEAWQKQGFAFKKKEAVHKEAMQNLASAVYRRR